MNLRVRSRFGMAVAVIVAVAACDFTSPIDATPEEIEAGTWGGERAGLIATTEMTHVHIGCTYGDFPAHIAIGADSRFSVAGSYLVRAYPVAIGPTMPAQLAGIVRGDEIVMTIAVNDTIEKNLVVFGPVTVRYGSEPQMGPCPICTKPGDAPGADAMASRRRAGTFERLRGGVARLLGRADG